MEDEQLIRSVRNKPFLYDRNDPKHNNRDLIWAAWEEVATEVQNDVELVKRRWVQLRDYFMRIIRTEKRSRTGEPILKKRKWPLFDRMTFLLPYLRSHSVVIDTDDSSSFADMDEAPQFQCEDAFQTIVHKNEPHSNESDSESTQLPSNVLYQHRHKDRHYASDADMSFGAPKKVDDMEENDLFFKSLTPIIRKLTPLKAMEFRHEVHGLLLQYLREQEGRATTSGNEMHADSVCLESSKTTVP